MSLFRACVQDYQLTKAEADAVESLLLHIPESASVKLSKLAATHGMIKGPITHAGIASKALRLNYSGKIDVDWYADRMSNDENTITIILDRVLGDFMNTPAGMRSSAGDDRVQALQKISSMFQLYLEDLSNKLPEEIFRNESAALWTSFSLGCFDEHLLDSRQTNQSSGDVVFSLLATASRNPDTPHFPRARTFFGTWSLLEGPTGLTKRILFLRPFQKPKTLARTEISPNRIFFTNPFQTPKP